MIDGFRITKTYTVTLNGFDLLTLNALFFDGEFSQIAEPADKADYRDLKDRIIAQLNAQNGESDR